jgi:isopenicillin-N epimerase
MLLNDKKMKPNSTLENQRRNFLKKAFAATLASLTFPVVKSFSATGVPAGQKRNFGTNNNEQYWELIKKQFTVPPELMMVNAANLCPSPYFIQDKVIDHLKKINANVSFQYREAYTQKRDEALSLLAKFLGVSKEEVTITRNTSESNSFVVNGLDFKAGDEIIVWDQNHPTNGIAWENRSKRYGFSVKKVSVPLAPRTSEDLLNSFAKAITGKTKLISFSHISNTSGIALPAKAICTLANEKGILTLVDGAQSFGMMDFDLKDIGCDFYTASTHKWLMGPLENGILYVNKEKIDRLWPTLVGAGWKPDKNTVDEKFATLGQRNETTTVALADILEFHFSIGRKNIEQRVMQLTAYLREKIQTKIPGVKFISPVRTELSAGILIVELPGKDSKEIHQKLYANHGIASAPSGGVRFSPHIYNTLADMDKIAAALTTLVKA